MAVILGLTLAEFERRSTWLLGDLDRRLRSRNQPARDTPADWVTLAACRRPGVDPEWFYAPDRDEVPNYAARLTVEAERFARAARVCGECPVRVECVADADGDRFGYRAGPPQERGWDRLGQKQGVVEVSGEG